MSINDRNVCVCVRAHMNNCSFSLTVSVDYGSAVITSSIIICK